MTNTEERNWPCGRPREPIPTIIEPVIYEEAAIRYGPAQTIQEAGKIKPAHREDCLRGQQHADESLVSLTEVTRWLLQATETYCTWFMPSDFAETHPTSAGWYKTSPRDGSSTGILLRTGIYLICGYAGGTETVLYTSWLFQRIVPPVLFKAQASDEFRLQGYRKSLIVLVMAFLSPAYGYGSNAPSCAAKREQETPHASDRDLVEELVGRKGRTTWDARPRPSVSEIQTTYRPGPNPSMSSGFLF